MNIKIDSLEFNKHLIKNNTTFNITDKEYVPKPITINSKSIKNAADNVTGMKSSNNLIDGISSINRNILIPESISDNPKTDKKEMGYNEMLAGIGNKLVESPRRPLPGVTYAEDIYVTDTIKGDSRVNTNIKLNDFTVDGYITAETEQVIPDDYSFKYEKKDSIRKENLDKITGIIDGLAITRNDVKVVIGAKNRRLNEKIPWELEIYPGEDPFLSGVINFIAGGALNSVQENAKLKMILLSNAFAYNVKGVLPFGDDYVSLPELDPEQVTQFNSDLPITKDSLITAIVAIAGGNLPTYGTYLSNFLLLRNGWKKDFRRYAKVGNLANLVDKKINTYYTSYTNFTKKGDVDLFSKVPLYDLINPSINNQLTDYAMTQERWNLLKDKFKNRNLGFLHTTLLYPKNVTKKMLIPFQFNLILDEGEISAQYEAMTFLGRVGEIFSYSNTKLSTISLSTKYIILSKEGDVNGDSYLQYWNTGLIENIIGAYKSLVYPYWNKETDDYFRPPLVRICNNNSSPYSSSAATPLTNKFKNFIVTSVSVKNNVDENEIYVNELNGGINGISYDVSLNLAEVGEDYLNKQDTMSDFYSVLGFISD